MKVYVATYDDKESNSLPVTYHVGGEPRPFFS